MSHRNALAWILLIWTLSSTLALPNMIYSVVVEDRLVNENLALTCTMVWPDGRYPLSSYDHIYNIVILVLTYLVPISTMAILYYRVGKELWGYEAIGENIEKQQRALMAKKKIVKMMIVVVIIFALCWLPYHAFFVVNYYLPTIFQDGPLFYQRSYLIMYWLAMSNSMYNPIIIYFMNSKFRLEFKRVLYFICCCRVYMPPPQAMSSDATQVNARALDNNGQQQQQQQQQQPVGTFTHQRHGSPSTIAAPRSRKSTNENVQSSFNQNSVERSMPVEIVVVAATRADQQQEHHTSPTDELSRELANSSRSSSERDPFLVTQRHHGLTEIALESDAQGSPACASAQAMRSKVWI